MFTGEADCTYFFTWDTKHACVREKEALLCRVADGRKRYDLSALARHAGAAPTPRSASCVCVCVRARVRVFLPPAPRRRLEMLFLFLS